MSKKICCSRVGSDASWVDSGGTRLAETQSRVRNPSHTSSTICDNTFSRRITDYLLLGIRLQYISVYAPANYLSDVKLMLCLNVVTLALSRGKRHSRVVQCQTLYSVLSDRVCTYACTPRSSTETGELHSVSLAEHVKSRQIVQSRLTRESLCSCTRKPSSACINCTCRCNLNLPQASSLSGGSGSVRIVMVWNHRLCAFRSLASVSSTWVASLSGNTIARVCG